MTRILAFATRAALAVCLFPMCLAAQDSVRVVVRGGDRQTVVVSFTDPPDGGVQFPTAGFATLLDAATATVIPLEPTTFGCGAGLTQMCVRLANSARLIDTKAYALHIGTLKFGGKEVVPGTLKVPAVGGKVLLSDVEGSRVVQATYSLDLSAQNVEPEIVIGGKNVLVRSGAANLPACYSTSSYRFSCQISRGLRNGDVVTFRLVDRGTRVPVNLPPIEPATAEFEAVEKEEDARFLAKGNYSREKDAEWSLQLLIQNLAWLESPGGKRSNQWALGPFLDARMSSDTSDPGSFNVGPEGRITFLSVGPLEYLRVNANTRLESDKDKTVQHWMNEVAFHIGIPYVGMGRLPGRGNYSFVPAFGYERGNTTKGDTVTRLEANDPRRWKGALAAHLGWPSEIVKLPRALGFLPFAGVAIDGSATIYKLKKSVSALGANADTPVSLNASFTYKFNPYAGLSISWRDGKLAPVFKQKRLIEFGTSIMY